MVKTITLSVPDVLLKYMLPLNSLHSELACSCIVFASSALICDLSSFPPLSLVAMLLVLSFCQWEWLSKGTYSSTIIAIQTLQFG